MPTPAPVRLPKFLIADDCDERDFVVHLRFPRFLWEFDYDTNTGEIVLWIDPHEEVVRLELEAGREPAALMARLLREAGGAAGARSWARSTCGGMAQGRSRSLKSSTIPR